jgi:alpha-L-fucosidase
MPATPPRLAAAVLALALGLAMTPPAALALPAVPSAAGAPANRPERLEWFRDLGFGLFIHWSHDSQVGSVISHSMVGASEDYLHRFIHDLPKSFSPRKFAPQDWAVLARLAGMRYVVFTTKHHSGFCMFHTDTTDFGIRNTPFRRDLTAEILDAFRAEGLAAGVYFSPDDFWWLHRHGITIQRNIPAVQPRANPGLMTHAQAQLRELFTRYGRIDVAFFDGEPEGLREVAWQLQPEVVVTRGAIRTPEQHIPGAPIDEPWEACITMGTQWQYKPTNEAYKSGGELIGLLIETRAKGGNLLLNVGPKPDGELPIEQEERLREIALWMFVNGESIHGVRPWIVTNEGPVWFTHNRKTDTLYAIVKTPERWPLGGWRDFVLHSVKSSPRTVVSVVGQNDLALEYQPDVLPKTTWRQEADGLHVRAMRAQRLYNDRKWPNPVVLRITHPEPALVPPRVDTLAAAWDAAARAVRVEGDLQSLGDTASVEVFAEHRDITGLDVNERVDNWTISPALARSAPGKFTLAVTGLRPGRTYEVRAVVRHPLLVLPGREVRVRVP